MRIKHVECDQFAGLLNKEFDFDEGLNIIVGENESGKSTIVDLIYYLLFKDAKLDGRSDSEFIGRYFPKNISGPQGDVVDGIISFETENGTYKLKKEWEKGEGTCRLILPNGTSIKGKDEIRNVLQDELEYRAGVYSEIVFASQKRNQNAVESILGQKPDVHAETRSDLTSTLTQAALETGGVTIKNIGETIEEKKKNLINHWDWNADAPQGGAAKATYKTPWKKEVGEILKAYYDVDETRSRQADAEKAERDVEESKSKIMKLQADRKTVEDDRLSFKDYKGVLGQLSLLTKSIEDLDKKIKEQTDDFKKWPVISSKMADAAKLQKKQKYAQIHNLFLEAEPVHRLYLENQKKFEELIEVDSDDLIRLKDLTRQKQNEESKVAGLNLVAKIKRLGSEEINITSISTGNAISIREGEVQITEAVDISIPGIMEMQLIPQGIDIDTVKQNLISFESKIKALYEKYNVSSLEELDSKSEIYSDTKRNIEILEKDLKRILGDKSWEDIKTANDTVPENTEPEEEIKKQIADLCGNKSLDAFSGGLEATITDYQKKYKDSDSLKTSIEKLEEEKEANQRKLKSMDDIPEKYRKIEDPERYDSLLEEKIRNFEKQIEDCNRKLEEAVRQLGEKSAEEYTDELQDKEAEFKALKDEYAHWLNIESAFRRLKDQLSGNPAEDIEVKFREYLEILTDGSLKLDSMDEKMSVQLASGTHALSYDILSEGTKDTISLAFRLAMLEHLYPEGNGLAVFDDPFTDMDPKRVEQACKLIQKYAEKNQVIFVTCDDKYNKYLEGNWISI